MLHQSQFNMTPEMLGSFSRSLLFGKYIGYTLFIKIYCTVYYCKNILKNNTIIIMSK